MSKVIDLFGPFQNEDDKLKFMESQFEVITKLTKEYEQIKKEKQHLESLLKQNVKNFDNTIEKEDPSKIIENICMAQLELLNATSNEREITREEAMKVDTYAKLLFQIKGIKKVSASLVDKMPVGDLLKLVKSDDHIS